MFVIYTFRYRFCRLSCSERRLPPDAFSRVERPANANERPCHYGASVMPGLALDRANCRAEMEVGVRVVHAVRDIGLGRPRVLRHAECVNSLEAMHLQLTQDLMRVDSQRGTPGDNVANQEEQQLRIVVDALQGAIALCRGE